MKTYVMHFISDISSRVIKVSLLVLLIFFWLMICDARLVITPASLMRPFFASQSTVTSEAVLSLTQDNTTVNASGVGLTDFAYLKSSFYVHCRSTTLSYTNGQSATGLTNQQWVCFKAKDTANNTWKYAALQVDLTLTPIKAQQVGRTIVAESKDLTTDLSLNDVFGRNVSFNGDTLVVGAYLDDGHDGINTGAIHIFKRTGTTWALKQEISDQSSGFTALKPNDYFGYSTSLDGDRLAVGAHLDDGYGTNGNNGANTGAVYIFKRTTVGGTVSWQLEQEISDQSSGFTALKRNDKFGVSVSLDGDRLAVGAYGDDGYDSSAAGAVYIFKRTTVGGTVSWQLEQEISDQSSGFNNLASGDKFGGSVSLDGDRLAVGAHGDEGHGGKSLSGAVYIFKRTTVGGTVSWQLEKELSKKSNELTVLDSGDYFGTSISLSGDRLAVGAHLDDGHGTGNDDGTDTGSVYIFKRTTVGGTVSWELEQEISDQSSGFTALKGDDQFGYSVSLFGDRLVTGAHKDDGGSGANTGAVYVFEKNSNHQWILKAEISDQSSNFKTLQTKDHFGYSVSLDGNDLAVGIYGNHALMGGAYIFEQTGTTWVLKREISGQTPIMPASWQNNHSSATTISSTCDSTVSFGATSNSANIVTAASADNQKWICFRAKNKKGVYSYANQQVNLSVIITLTQSGNQRVSASATTTLGASIKSDSWQYFKTSNSTAPDCDSSATFTNLTTADKSVAITLNDVGKWLCFRVQNSNDVYGYESYQIVAKPILILTQDNTTVTATSSGLSGNDFAYFVSTSNPDCSDNNETAVYIQGSSATNMTTSQWVCFRGDQNSNQIYGYAKLQLDLTPPVLNLTQTNATMTASGVNLTDFAYFISEIDPDCSDANTTDTYTLGSSATGLVANRWVCFKAKNQKGVYGWQERKFVEQTTNPPSNPITPTTTAAPTLVLTQVDNTVTATATEANGFAYFISETDPDCSDANTTGVYTDGQRASNLKDKQWVCFKAKNSQDVYGYAKIQVSLISEPVTTAESVQLILTQVGNSVKARGANLTQFAYFISETDPDCSDANTTGVYTDGQRASNLKDKQWVCFKANNSSLGWLYKDIQVSIVVSVAPATGSSQPRVAQTEDNLATPPTQPQKQAPKLDLLQAGDKVSVTNLDLTDHQFFVSKTNPQCSKENQAAIYRSGKFVSGLTDGQWVCFKAKNSQGVYGYAKLKVSLPASDNAAGVLITAITKKPSISSQSNSYLNLTAIVVLSIAIVVWARLLFTPKTPKPLAKNLSKIKNM